jgi:uncharacterized protein YecT (DUF1311 family)
MKHYLTLLFFVSLTIHAFELIGNDVSNGFAYEDCIAKADINYNYMSPIRLPYDLEECYLIGYAIEDKKLNEIYKELMSKLPEKDKKELEAKQRQWIKERDKKIHDNRMVLDRSYRKIKFLEKQIRYEIVKHRVDELVALNKQVTKIKEVDIPDENIETVRNDVSNEFDYKDCIAKANARHTSVIGFFRDIITCKEIRYDIEDKKLNEIYKELMSKLSEKDKKELRAKQRQWIKERDKNALTVYGDKYKSLSQMIKDHGQEGELEYVDNMYESTKKRVDELVELNKQIDADDFQDYGSHTIINEPKVIREVSEKEKGGDPASISIIYYDFTDGSGRITHGQKCTKYDGQETCEEVREIKKTTK